MVAELKMVCCDIQHDNKYKLEHVQPVNKIVAVKECIEILAAQKELQCLGEDMKVEFKDIFSEIPHLDELPTNVYCCIKLKDALKTVQTQSYSTPRKYWKAWATLIQQHLDAGHIHPSNSSHASPAFMVPKSDITVLPCWVNDYRMLNANTVLDAHLLP